MIINYDFTCRFNFLKVILGVLDSLFDKYRKWGHKIVRRSDHVAANSNLWSQSEHRGKKFNKITNALTTVPRLSF